MRRSRHGARLALALILGAFIALALAGVRNTSTTFDETLFPSAGARALHTGDFTLVRDHPRLPQYLYGFPAWLMHPIYPAEIGWSHDSRYAYAQAFFFGSGNDGPAIAFAARMVAVLCGAALVLATFLCARRHAREADALVAAGLVALVPDVIAHSGISYNDVPAALTILAALYALDRCARHPTPRAGLAAGVACGLALATKTTALVLAPMAAVLFGLELAARRGAARAWLRDAAIALAAAALAAYAVLVAIYLGDFRLRELVRCIGMNVEHVSLGHVVGNFGTVPAYLFGATSPTGWWYFFPVALALKMPFAFHALAVIALAGAWMSRRSAALAGRFPFSGALRAPLVGLVGVGVTLLTAHLQIGVRHALPLVPFACILVAHGVGAAWRAGPRALRTAIVTLLAADAACVLLVYPYFLSYLTEAVRGRPAYTVLSDSNTDWGQGLVALGDFMRERGIDQVALGYFGSAFPEAYGVRYVPLPSQFPLRGDPASAAPPRYAAISLTLLSGTYFAGADPYASYRQRKPLAVVGGVFWIFERPR